MVSSFISGPAKNSVEGEGPGDLAQRVGAHGADRRLHARQVVAGDRQLVHSESHEQHGDVRIARHLAAHGDAFALPIAG